MYSVYYREEELNMNIDNAKYLDKIEKIQKRYPYQQMPEHLKRAFEQDMRIRLSWNTNSLEGLSLIHI